MTLPPAPGAAFDPDGDERAVFHALLDHDPALCSAQEIALIVGSELAAADGIAALERDGLLHRVGDLVALNRAAVRAQQLA